MKIRPNNSYLLLDTYDVPREQGKIILPSAPKDTQLYKVTSEDGVYEVGTLLYLKSQPRCLLQGDNKFYIADVEDIIATVIL